MFFSLRISTAVRAPLSSSSPSNYWRRTKTAATLKVTLCSLRIQDIDVESRELLSQSNDKRASVTGEVRTMPEDIEHGEDGISGIQVPRQRYIAISKSELLDAIVLMFESQEEIDQFLLLSSCLDSILHAEHRRILEEMRLDYNRVDSSPRNIKGDSSKDSRVAIASRFQRAFVQLLYNAQFEELSARDLMLTSALNSDYLLTLPIYVDWKRAYESNAIIFRRGYATERQKGLLIVEKLDYLQSKLLQGIFFTISKPLGKIVIWITEAFKSASQGQIAQVWIERVKLWLKELPLFQQSYSYGEQTSDKLLEVDQLSDNDLPIWLAAQRAVTRYEGILSPIGPRGRLFRKLLMWIGLLSAAPEKPFDLESDVTTSESYLRPIFLSRITLSDIWKPATKKCCGNDSWKMLKTAISILFSSSILQEPAFQELILLFTNERGEGKTKDTAEVPSLELKIYERISIPDLPVIFPHKKLSFRILDTVRLDVATILGLSAFFINYKFEDILLSPSAVLLDVIAVSALIIYVIRVALGYKQTWDRYQLLVNKTLYEKTLASGFGSVHFLLDASEQQQYKEAILAYAILLKAKTGQTTSPKDVKDKCERFMHSMFKEKVEMPVDKAMHTLVRLGLVVEKEVDQKIRLQVIPCLKAYDILKRRWNSLLS